MAQKTYPSLDRTGTQAAVYPSEEALWVSGPPITDPGPQGVSEPVQGPLMSPQREDDWLHEVVNGPTPNGAYEEIWVNPLVYGPTGFGPWNDESIYQSGHSQNVVSNPSSEQGWGVGPARRWAHYPHDEAPNPKHNMGQHLRNGELPYVSNETALYYRTQLEWEHQWGPSKYRSPVAPVVQVPPSVPFVQTVPTYSGGAVAYEGIDVPIGVEGIY